MGFARFRMGNLTVFFASGLGCPDAMDSAATMAPPVLFYLAALNLFL